MVREFNLEIISKEPNPIKLIKFENLSHKQPFLSQKIIKETGKDKNGYSTLIYYINANFSLNPMLNTIHLIIKIFLLNIKLKTLLKVFCNQHQMNR